MLHSCETTETMSKDAPCDLVTVEKQSSEMTQPLSAASPQTSQVGLFVSGVSFVLLGILSFFSVLAVQITIPKYKELPGQFYLLLQWAKHINKTYSYVFQFAVDNFSCR